MGLPPHAHSPQLPAHPWALLHRHPPTPRWVLIALKVGPIPSPMESAVGTCGCHTAMPKHSGSYGPGPAEQGRVQAGLGAEGAHTRHSLFLEAFSPFLLCPDKQAGVPRRHLPHRSQGPQESIQDGKTLTLRCHKKACLGTPLVVQRLRLCASSGGGAGSTPGQGTKIRQTPAPAALLGFSICTWILRTSAPTVSQHSEEQGV